MMLPTEPQKKKKMAFRARSGCYLYLGICRNPLSCYQRKRWSNLRAIFYGLIHPDWSYVYTGDGEDLFSLMIETVAIAFVGTFISSLLSIPFAFWAARSKNTPRFLSSTGKVVLTAIRTFPEIVLAIMFIKTVGPGSLRAF